MSVTNTSSWSYSGTVITCSDKNKDDENRTFVYNVIVVTTKGEIIIDKKVVARNAEEAKFKAEVYRKMHEDGLTFEDVTIITNSLGEVNIENKNK